jgi:hypothetical protein
VKFFGCHWGEVGQRLVGTLVIEEVDPVQGLELDVLDAAPRPFGPDGFGLS